MSEIHPIRVFIVDDHPIVRDGLKNMLLAFDDLLLVGEAGDGLGALAFCQANQADVFLMDMYMPEKDGIATTRELLEHCPQARVLMLTSFVDDHIVRDALEAGAVGFMLKNAPINTLADAIRSAYAGQPALSPEATRALIRLTTAPLKPGHDLSQRELEVLAFIVQGMSNEEIAEQLVISHATVRHHVSACLQKLGAANRAQAASLATKHNLVR